MTLNPDFIIQSMGDDTLLIPVDKAAESFHGLVRLNETAAFIVSQLGQDTTPAAIADAMLAEYEVDRPTAEANIAQILDQLRSVGALIE